MRKRIQLRGREWIPLSLFDGMYSVSSDGLIRSNIAYNGKGKQLSQHLRNGYLEVCLFDHTGYRNSYRVHRLVTEAFIGPIPDGMQVNHINGIKTDNRVENLEIVSPSENMKHAYRIGLVKPSNNGLQKKVIALREGIIVGEYCSIREMCRQLSLDRRSVLRTIQGDNKQHNGYTFEIAI